jgi:undecaprenyl-diphosphatase
MDIFQEIDSQLLLWLNGSVGASPSIDNLARWLVSDYMVPVLLSLSIFALWFWGEAPHFRDIWQRIAIKSIVAIGLSNLAVLILNQFFQRARPFDVYELELLFYRPLDPSFPANPAAFSFAVATCIWQGNKKFGFAIYLLSGSFCFARIYAGVFYPSDVLAGAVIGIAMALIGSKVMLITEPIPTMILRTARRIHLG